MQVIVLVIVDSGTESITIHETRESASEALRRFMYGQWRKRFGVAFPDTDLTTEAAARQYFSDGSRTFIIGEASLSEIEAHYDVSPLS